jgi:plasmid stabilization system protein ParE
MAKIIWTIPALQGLDEIADYIALDDPDAAKKLVRKVFDQVEKLAQFPASGALPPELKRTPYRRVVVAPVLIYYRMEREDILIIHTRRGERKFSLKDIKSSER